MALRECPNHLKLMMSALKNEKQLCDVTIKAGKDTIKVHRLVLVAASKYFRAMFFNDTKESKTGIVQFPGTPKDVVKQCIGFIYSGKVEFSLENITEFMKTSDIIGLHNLTELYVEFLSENVNLNNVIEMMSVAQIFNREMLKESIQDFFLVNFGAFVKSGGYLSLRYDCFTYMLSLVDNFGRVNAELKVNAIMNWIKQDSVERKDHFIDLLHMIDLSFLSKKFMRERVMTEDFASDSKECLETITDSFLGGKKDLNQTTTSCGNSRGSQLDPENSESGGVEEEKQQKRKVEGCDSSKMSDIKKSRNTKTLRHIITCNLTTKVVYRGNLENDRWSRVTKLPVESTSNLDIIEYRGFIYVGCGNQLFRFDGTSWKKVWEHPMKDEMCYNRCVQTGECIYMVTTSSIVAHQLSTARSTLVNCDNSISEKFFVASSSENLYIMGGISSGTNRYCVNQQSAKVWNIKSKYIQGLPSMINGRASGVGVFYQDTVYAIGGGPKSVEFLNPVTEQWQIVKDLEIDCSSCKALLTDKLYLFGGYRLESKVIAIELEKLEVSDEERRPARKHVAFHVFCASY